MAQQAYKTVAGYGCEEFIITKSRFIGHATPVANEEEALQFLAKMRAQYKDASHNCYCYVLGQNMGIQRYNDDGEPGGTAGLPMIEVVKAQGVVDVAVVVTRYFGGVLLGAGGLVRAYTQGAAVALKAARVVTMHKTLQLLFEAEYAAVGRIDYFLKDQPVRVNNRDFGQDVTYDLSIRQADAPAFLQALATVTMGKAEAVVVVEERYMGWEE